MRRAIKAILVGIATFLLGGCLLVEMQLSVSSDDTVSGTMVLAVEEEAADALGELNPQDSSLVDVGELPEGATAEPYSQDGYVGQKVTFQDVPLEQFNNDMQQDGGTFSIVREGDQLKFTGTIELDTGESADSSSGVEGLDAALEQALASSTMTLAITFPGKVLDTNGEVDGTTVTWNLADLLQESEVYATAQADGADKAGDPAQSDQSEEAVAASSDAEETDSEFPVLPVVLGVVAAIIVIGGAAFLVTRRRKA